MHVKKDKRRNGKHPLYLIGRIRLDLFSMGIGRKSAERAEG